MTYVWKCMRTQVQWRYSLTPEAHAHEVNTPPPHPPHPPHPSVVCNECRGWASTSKNDNAPRRPRRVPTINNPYCMQPWEAYASCYTVPLTLWSVGRRHNTLRVRSCFGSFFLHVFTVTMLEVLLTSRQLGLEAPWDSEPSSECQEGLWSFRALHRGMSWDFKALVMTLVRS